MGVFLREVVILPTVSLAEAAISGKKFFGMTTGRLRFGMATPFGRLEASVEVALATYP